LHPEADDLHDDKSESEKYDAGQPRHHVAVVAVAEEESEGGRRAAADALPIWERAHAQITTTLGERRWEAT
jgi:hypothetical protein